ncbi:MAG: helix-turn-helix domain-containing protein [Gaiellaceae bacterium]
MPAREPDLLTKSEAAEKLHVSPSTVDRLRAQGEIAWVPVGRQVRFRPEAIADYVERVERPARAEGEREVPLPRARSFRASASGPRRRLPEANAGFDELFPITMPVTAGGGTR